jgi:hypothetical protein
MWWNPNTRELQSNSPWFPSNFVSNDVKQQYFDAGWELVYDGFIPPLTKLQKIAALNVEYMPMIVDLQQRISFAVTVTKNATAEARLRQSLTDLQAEQNQKRSDIINGTG